MLSSSWRLLLGRLLLGGLLLGWLLVGRLLFGRLLAGRLLVGRRWFGVVQRVVYNAKVLELGSVSICASSAISSSIKFRC